MPNRSERKSAFTFSLIVAFAGVEVIVSHDEIKDFFAVGYPYIFAYATMAKYFFLEQDEKI